MKRPFVISLGPLTHAENVVVRMDSDDGVSGWGECSPFRTIHGETIETCMSIGKEIAGTILSSQPTDPVQLLSLMDTLVFGNTSIKSAFDIAFHDLLSRRADMPLFRFLGGIDASPIFTDYTVSIGEPGQMVQDAVDIQQKGFPVIKVKLGGDPETDILRMHVIRKAVGNTIPIRIDANQGWSLEGAVKALHGMKGLSIQHCEEPLPRHAFDRLPSLRQRSPIPLMADESCCNEFDAERLIASEATDGFNIKLGKSSGIVRAKRIVDLGKTHGLTLQAGGFLESRLGFSATAHFVAAYPEIIHVDFDTPLMFAEDPISGGILYGMEGRIELGKNPGIGAVLKEEFAANGLSVKA